MLSIRLKQLLDQAVGGNAEAFQTLQVEKLNQFANDPHQTEARLTYFETQRHEIINYFLQKQDISTCCSKLLIGMLVAINENNDANQIKIISEQLKRAVNKCSDDPTLCNQAGINIALLYLKCHITNEITIPAFHELILLQTDDAEGVVSYFQSLALENQSDSAENKARALIKLKQSRDKNNEMAFLRYAELLSEDQDLTEIDASNKTHKEIMRALKHAVSHGIPAAYYLLGNIFLMQKNNDDDASTQNTLKGIEFLMKGIDARNGSCMHRLATFYILDLLPRDSAKVSEAMLLLNFAANKLAFVDSKLFLAKILMNNNHTSMDDQKRNNEKALKLLNEVINILDCPVAKELKTTVLARLKPPIVVSKKAAKSPASIAMPPPPAKRPRMVIVNHGSSIANGVHTQTTSNVITALTTANNSQQVVAVTTASTQVASTTDYRLSSVSESNNDLLHLPVNGALSQANGFSAHNLSDLTYSNLHDKLHFSDASLQFGEIGDFDSVEREFQTDHLKF